MYRLYWLFIVFFFAASALANSPTRLLEFEPVDAPERRDALAHAAFKSLVEGDIASYLALHISYAEESKYERLRRSEKYYIARRKQRFEKLMKDIAADGVQLAKAKIVAIKRRSPPRKFKDILIIGDIEVIIESDQRRFRLVLDDVLAIKRGWVIGDRFKWFGRYPNPDLD